LDRRPGRPRLRSHRLQAGLFPYGRDGEPGLSRKADRELAAFLSDLLTLLGEFKVLLVDVLSRWVHDNGWSM
jgi:hypothetical protein